jgi:hypothetical protein
MLFAIGTRVRFRYTGETGSITAMLDDGMLQVRLDSDPDFEIPAFEEDLQRDEMSEPLSAGAKFVQGKIEKLPEAPPRRELRIQYQILKPKGLQLVFEPMPGRDGTVTRYKTWLLNDTTHEFLFEFDLFTQNRDVFSIDDKINTSAAMELGDILYDDLNEGLESWIRVQRLTTAGPDDALEHRQKIRPKQFFNNVHTVPFLNLPAHHFILIDAFEQAAKPAPEQDLKDYTQQKAKKPKPSGNSNYRPLSSFNVEEFASFDPEIDLHTEKLLPGHNRIDKGEILRMQMVHFHQFLDKAIRIGAPRVFVIHGVGEGKLRDSIADALRSNPHVVKFKNEFHHKYGYGATEVILE